MGVGTGLGVGAGVGDGAGSGAAAAAFWLNRTAALPMVTVPARAWAVFAAMLTVMVALPPPCGVPTVIHGTSLRAVHAQPASDVSVTVI